MKGMAERIYTIPTNEAFDAGLTEGACTCPFCTLYTRFEQNELELILGASMMEPDVRIQTNRQGFCKRHFKKMLTMKNRLGLTLMLESHLDELRREMNDALITLSPGAAAVKRVEALESSCYLCNRVARNFEKIFETAALLYEEDPAFRKKLQGQPYFCLPHYKAFLQTAKRLQNKKTYAACYRDANVVMTAYFDALREDVKHFCRKFDYRYEEEPWGNAKDAPERAVSFLKGKDASD